MRVGSTSADLLLARWMPEAGLDGGDRAWRGYAMLEETQGKPCLPSHLYKHVDGLFCSIHYKHVDGLVYSIHYKHVDGLFFSILYSLF